jgi:pimeloyl-ACP methyl ester carboxylesterase
MDRGLAQVIAVDRIIKIADYGSGDLDAAPKSPFTSNRSCLFIHGYNVEPERACETFVKLTDLLTGRGVPEVELRRAWLVQWPGFAQHWYKGRSWVSPFLYSAFVASAVSAGRALAAFLVQSGARDVVLMAHSLGSRVAVEAVRELHRLGAGGKVIGLGVLAAAVPQDLLRRLEYSNSLRSSLQTYTFHSDRDRVLSWAVFGVGQWLANERPVTEAVGRRGGPADLWKRAVATQNSHSSYLSDQIVGNGLAALLGYVTPTVLPKFSHRQGASTVESVLPSTLASGNRRRLPARRVGD